MQFHDLQCTQIGVYKNANATERNTPKKLMHKRTGRIFTFVAFKKPQFSTADFVVLLNSKTGKEEAYDKSTYLNYFEYIKQ
jgi:hypothetical protein